MSLATKIKKNEVVDAPQEYRARSQQQNDDLVTSHGSVVPQMEGESSLDCCGKHTLLYEVHVFIGGEQRYY